MADASARTVLVTGAGGWIGAHVVAACRARGWRVLAIGPRMVPAVAADVWYAHRCSAEQPLPPELAEIPIDGLIHLAWPIDPATYLVSPANTEALATSNAVVQAALARGCRQVVIAGTCAEYARGAGDGGVIGEDAEVAPDTLYASCKVALHIVARALCTQAGAALAWGRIFHLYGPGENPARLVPALVRTFRAGGTFAAASGRQRRDFLRVEDIASAFATLLGAEGAYNICSGEGVALAEVMREVHAICAGQGRLELGAKPDRAWEPEALVGDCAKLRALGWVPRWSLDEGLSDYADRLATAEKPESVP